MIRGDGTLLQFGRVVELYSVENGKEGMTQSGHFSFGSSAPGWGAIRHKNGKLGKARGAVGTKLVRI